MTISICLYLVNFANNNENGHRGSFSISGHLIIYVKQLMRTKKKLSLQVGKDQASFYWSTFTCDTEFCRLSFSGSYSNNFQKIYAWMFWWDTQCIDLLKIIEVTARKRELTKFCVTCKCRSVKTGLIFAWL